MEKLLTVLIPVFNNTSVSVSIESVLKYKTSRVELIVIDGGSTDKTMSRINRYADFIDELISEKDKGMYDALNKGIARARGKWVFCLAADDILKCDLEKIILKYGQTGADLMCGNMIVKYTENKFWKDFSKHDLSLLDYRCTLRHPATLFRKEAYEKYGPYDGNYICAGDRELFLRFRNKGAKFTFIPEYIVLFALGGLSGTDPIKGNFKEDKEISDRYGMSKIRSRFVFYYRIADYVKTKVAKKTNLSKPVNKLLYILRLKKRPHYLTKLQVEKIFDEQERRLV